MHIAAAREINDRLLPALRHLLDGARRQGRGLRRHRQDRPHASAGRDAGHPRPGVLRLRRAGASSASRASRRPCPGSTPSPRAAPPSAPGSTPTRNSRERFAAQGRASSPALPFTSAENKFEALAVARRARLHARRPHQPRRRPVQDRQRHPPDGLRAALGPRRDQPARERARLLDHARQGQPDPGRGHDDGLHAGDRQQRHRRLRGQPGAFRAERVQAGDRQRRAAVDPPPRRRVRSASPTTASSASSRTGSASASSCSARSCW